MVLSCDHQRSLVHVKSSFIRVMSSLYVLLLAHVFGSCVSRTDVADDDEFSGVATGTDHGPTMRRRAWRQMLALADVFGVQGQVASHMLSLQLMANLSTTPSGDAAAAADANLAVCQTVTQVTFIFILAPVAFQLIPLPMHAT